LLNSKYNKNEKYHKLLCSIFVFILLISLIQVNTVLASNTQINNNTLANSNNNNGNNNNSSSSSSNVIIDKRNVTNADNIKNNRVSIGPDLHVFEGDIVSLRALIVNAISLPSQSVIYSWNQVEGPKINLAEEEKQNKNLQFIAPNRPNDSKYVFELKVIQKTESKNVILGKDSVTITVLDINKAAKGVNMQNIPGISGERQNNSNFANQ
jgi:hypothetical protein